MMKGNATFIDIQYEELKQAKYTRYTEFLKSYLIAKKNGKYGVVNVNQEVKIPFIYDSLEQLGKGDRFKLEKDKKFGITDHEHNVIIPFDYDEIKTDFIGFFN